jgi:hypothetical protein
MRAPLPPRTGCGHSWGLETSLGDRGGSPFDSWPAMLLGTGESYAPSTAARTRSLCAKATGSSAPTR